MFGNLQPASGELRFFANFSGGSAPSQGPVANGFMTGCLGRSNIDTGSSRYDRKTLKEYRWKDFARQTDPSAIQFKYRIARFQCGICFLDTISATPDKWAYWRRLNGQRVLSRQDWKVIGKLALPNTAKNRN
jgi:hypothetical protein